MAARKNFPQPSKPKTRSRLFDLSDQTSISAYYWDSTSAILPAVVLKKINDLAPNDRHARTHSDKQIAQVAASIRECGFLVPIIVDGDNRILAGHGRLAAAKLLGLARVPVITIDHLSEEQMRAYVIADNRLAELAGWDRGLLAIELKELSTLDLGFDVELTGFGTTQIDLLIEELESNASDDTDPIPPQLDNTPPVSRDGDLWILGDHRLICGNALEQSTPKRLVGDEVADMVFIDPPFNVVVDGHVGGLGNIRHREFAMASGEMTEAEFITFLQTSLNNHAQFCVDGAVLFVCMDWRHLFELQTAARQAGLSTLNLCVWAKTNAGMGSFYRSQHELVLILKKGTASHTNNIQLGRYGRYRTNLWRYEGANTLNPNRRAELALHPTVKPVALVADAIKDVTRRDDLVLDGFCGSGTTILAAQKSGRRCYAVELDPGYVDVAIQRWQTLTGEDAVHADTGKTFEEVTANRPAAPPRCRKRCKPVEA